MSESDAAALLVEQIKHLKDANAELLEALRFYADKEKYDEFRVDSQAAAFDRDSGSDLGDDRGNTARQAIQKHGRSFTTIGETE